MTLERAIKKKKKRTDTKKEGAMENSQILLSQNWKINNRIAP